MFWSLGFRVSAVRAFISGAPHGSQQEEAESKDAVQVALSPPPDLEPTKLNNRTEIR